MLLLAVGYKSGFARVDNAGLRCRHGLGGGEEVVVEVEEEECCGGMSSGSGVCVCVRA